LPKPSAPYRLCFVNSMRTWGGAEVWMLDTALALQQRGHAVDIVTNRNSELHQRAHAAGLSVTPVHIRFDGAFWTIAALAWHLRRSGATAVIANRTKDAYAAGPAGRLVGVATILATRESDFPIKSRFDYNWVFNHLCTGVLVNSRATRGTILNSAPWLDPDRVHLLYKSIDTDRFSPATTAQEGPPVIGFVGQLIARKGLHELMQAWAEIDQQDRAERPVLRLAGEGILRQELETWRGSLRHPVAVQILGYAQDVETFYQDLRTLVLPSHREGFGLAAAEAQACEVPVIAGAASSLPEIVVDEETGLLVAPGDSEALAVALTRLLDDPALARRLGRAGRRHILAKFPHAETLNRLLQLTGHPDYQTTAQQRKS